MRCCRRDLWRSLLQLSRIIFLRETKGSSFEVELTWVYAFLCGIESCELFRGFWQWNELATRCWMLFPWNISWCAGRWWSQWVVMATFQLLFVMKVIWFDTLWATLMRLWLYSFSHYLEIYLVEISVHFYRFMCMYMYEWKHTPMAPFV